MRIRSSALPRTRGFTLIELLAVLAIIGILAAIAFPAYGSFMTKGNRGAAQAYMMDLAHAEAQYFADSRSYTETVSALGVPAPAALAGKYTIKIEAPDALPPSFTISATPVPGSIQAKEDILTLNNSGARTPAGKW
ncbi:type IV pilin protein [Massilia sp. LXY-6]|uniref:type IV pilin protein n=1 Tax=Massilia sp. LXY-6 TaxID=3379823 RepID=UPI003EE2DDDB